MIIKTTGEEVTRMSSAERLEEVARILALGILRLRAREDPIQADQPNQLGKYRLDISAEESVTRVEPETCRENS